MSDRDLAPELAPLTDDDLDTIRAATVSRADAELALAFGALDTIRESGAVNMFGAAPVLADMIGLDRAAARAAVVGWMATFDEEKTPTERVAELRATERTDAP